MSARIIDGKQIAAAVEQEVAEAVASLRERNIQPRLVAVRVGDDPASEVYVRSKAKKAEELGLSGSQLHLPSNVTAADLLFEIQRLNHDDSVDGILLQLPLPPQIDPQPMLDAIDPAKDVDGFHPMNVGRLHLGRDTLVPCTPAGVIRLIEATGVTIAGKRAVVVGRSDIVGKPVASLLLQRHATVTIAHSRTRDLAAVVREGEIVIAAVGRPLLVDGSMIREGAVVIDVGINRVEKADAAFERLSPAKKGVVEKRGSTLVGDVDFDSCAEVAGWITPVPGGVGPMTIAMLMQNTVKAAAERRR